MNKDTNNRIREEFLEQYGSDTDQMVSAHQSYMPEEVADWWLSKIAELLKSQREELVEKIDELPMYAIRKEIGVTAPEVMITSSMPISVAGYCKDDIKKLLSE